MDEHSDTLYLRVLTSELPTPTVSAEGATRGTAVFTENFSAVHTTCNVWGDYNGSTLVPSRPFSCSVSDNLNIISNSGAPYDGSLVWPNGKVMFYLTAPYEQSGVSDVTTSLEDGKPVFSFDFATPGTGDGAAVAQQDILFAACEAGESDFKNKSASQLPVMLFYHALAGIRFTLNPDLDPNVRIDAVELRNISSTGHCELRPYYYTSAAWNTLGGNSNANGSDETKSKSCAVWTPGTATASYKQTFTADDNGRPTPDYISQSGTLYELNGSAMEKTFFLIPQTPGADAEMVLTFTNTANGRQETKRVSFSTLPITWQAGVLYDYRISATPSPYNTDYTLDVQMPETHYSFAGGVRRMEVTSYKKEGTSNYDTQYQLQWLNGTTWTNFAEARPAGLDATVYLSDGTTSSSPETHMVYLKMDAAPQGESLPCTLSGEAVGSQSSPRDLSKYDAEGVYNEVNLRSTANCYIISQPGWYKFPLIYGNAVEQGEYNTSSYFQPTLTSVGQGQVRTTFLAHDDQPINSPSIEAHLNGSPTLTPSIVWMDASTLVQNVSITTVPENVAGQSVHFIQFQVPGNVEGNALIALKADDVIVWSWHIWVSSMDVRHGAENTDGTNYYRFMRNSLGTVYNASTTKCTPARDVTVRVVQQDADGNEVNTSNEYVLHQNAGVCGRSSSLYYQFGRKDPEPRANNSFTSYVSNGSTPLWNGTSSIEWGRDNLYFQPSARWLSVDERQPEATLGTAIQHPDMHMGSIDGQHENDGWWMKSGHRTLNLWSGTSNKYLQKKGTQEANGNFNYEKPKLLEDDYYAEYYNPSSLTTFVKTVYDPSPYGYQVPPLLAIKGFRHGDMNCVDNETTSSVTQSIIVSGPTETYCSPEGHRQQEEDSNSIAIRNPRSYYNRCYIFLSDMYNSSCAVYMHFNTNPGDSESAFFGEVPVEGGVWKLPAMLIFAQNWGRPEYANNVVPVRIFYQGGGYTPGGSDDDPAAHDDDDTVLPGSHEGIGDGGQYNGWTVK